MSESFCDATVVATCQNGGERHGRLADILDHYLRELECGVPPRVDALIEENPDLADELRDYVESLHLLHGMTAGLRQEAAPQTPTAQDARKQLGDYEILRELGRGGMGIVYEARQISLNRKVALKVLPFAAVLDEKQLARFRNEAQAAAQLHHPHIVPVFAVGQDRGVHFYAMQYIEGQSLDKARDDLCRQLSSPGTAPVKSATSPSARDNFAASGDTKPAATAATKASTQSRDYCRAVAQLGVQAAEALHHAHEFGIVHRDVKPSNLLLDRNRKLWVTDFGLARVQSCADVTLSGDVVGTLRYMSPEQAAGRNALVDPRSDVYALGATLYELLTLHHAHDGENREQLRHQIEHEEPRPPRAVNSAIPQDLETIVLAAMSKSREDRYGSAQEMADDISRFLQGRPTMARRPTFLERGARWMRRHQRAALVASLFLALVATVSTAGMLMIAGEKARTEEAKIAAEANLRDARRNLARAEEHFSQAREVVDRFGSRLAGQLAELPGSEPIRGALLRDTLAYYRQFIKHASDDPDLGDDLARTCFEAAQIAEQLGQTNEAQALYQQALACFAELAVARPGEAQLVAHQATCHNNLGLLLATQNDTEAAVDSYRQAIHLATRLAEQYPERAEFTRSLAETHGNLGLLWRQSGQVDEARQSLNEAVRLLRALIDGDSKAARPRHDLAIIYNNLSYIERQTDWDTAEISCRRAIAILGELAGEANESSAYVYDLALCHNNLGAIHSHRHQLSDAAWAYRQAIDLFEQLAGRAPAVVRYRRDLAVSLNSLGQLQSREQDWAGAESAFERAGQILGKLVATFPDELQFRSSLAGVLNNQGLVAEQTGDFDQAFEYFAGAIEHQRFAVDRAPQTPEYRNFVSKHYFNYARALRRAGRPDDATDMTLERRRLWADNPIRLFQISVELAEAFSAVGGGDSGDFEEGREHIADEALTTLKLAVDAGYELDRTLDEIEELASLRGHPRFDELAREIEFRRVDSADHEGGQ